MPKVLLNDVSNFEDNSTAVATTKANNDTIETAFDNTISRDGAAPNSMTADLDLNSNKVINLGEPNNPADAVTKSYVDLMQVTPPDATVSVFGASLIDDADAATARSTLGAAGLTDANVFTKTQTWKHGADVASAAALTLGDGNWFHITGTTSITSIGTKGIGTLIALHFEGALTLTHHATDLQLPGGKDISVSAGDVVILEEYAVGDWHLVSYTRDDGQQLEDRRIWVKGADIASAATLVIGTDGNYFDVTGAVGITGVTVPAGMFFILQFDSTPLLTHHATNLNLPTGANITAEAGDRAICFATAANNVIVLSYIRASGQGLVARSGSVVQQVITQDGTVATGTTVTPEDDTIPQNTEGNQFLSVTITPKSTSNILVIEAIATISYNGIGYIATSLYQDSTANALASVSDYNSASNAMYTTAIRHRMTAGTTSATTFKVRIGSGAAGTITFNGYGSARKLGGVMGSHLMVTEYAA